jgi:hypothetical protein
MNVPGWLGIRTEGVITFERLDSQIVDVHVLAGRNWFRREPDDLVVPPHELAGRDVPKSNFVPSRNCVPYRQAIVIEKRPGRNILTGDYDVIRSIQLDY